MADEERREIIGFAYGETRLVPMVEFLNEKGKVTRYTYPPGMEAEGWWENGITAEEAQAIETALEAWEFDATPTDQSASAKLRAAVYNPATSEENPNG